jgi:alkylhydroperoxidase family enzyme
MIHYTISSARKCQYCSINFKFACRSIGIDEEMLEALIHDLDAVAPKRTQEIIRFAVKCALDPQGLTEVDYDKVREQGLSNEEIVELIGWAAIAMYNDTISDSMKLGDLASQELSEA